MARLIGPPLSNIPWQEPDGDEPVWRYANNPIITAAQVRGANSVFNSAVVPFGGGFTGVFRVDDKRREMTLRAGCSADGLSFSIDDSEIQWDIPPGMEPPSYGYDPRVTSLEDRFLISFCSGFHGPTIALGETRDFKHFKLIENITLPYNRNGVIFPRLINGRYMMLSRPSDRGHTPFGDIFLSQSEDLIHWGRHRFVMKPEQPWESTKVGAGPVPIETSEGWLLIYHGVLTSCSGYVYHFGAALLDLEEPWRVIRRSAEYLLAPHELYERTGDVPNVVFPCAALTDSATGRIAVYYGAGDSVTALCFTTLDRLLASLR
ncbi:MAG: glycoside hydrolase family 130 protein [Armatimonadetes bacterium]|nr:glycoside hydrolase family 130 protein [Armatimonadota bacterium]